MKALKCIFPALFGCFVLLMAVNLGLGAYRELGIRGTVKEMVSCLKNADPDGWETRVNESLDKDHTFINLYGAAQRAMGRRFVEDAAGNPVAKLSNGQLTFAGITECVDQTGNAENIVRLKEELEGIDVPVMAVVAPTKLSNPAVSMPEGVEDQGNAMGDKLLELLEGRVDTLDLRPEFVKADPENRWFFNTDHHWRPEGALFACGTLMRELNAKYGFEINEQALDPGAYSEVTYPELFLGSQGKRVGEYYAGVDDFTVLTPEFETEFSYIYDGRTEPRVGTMNESLCFDWALRKDHFNNNPYAYYSGGDFGRGEITNLKNPDGPTVVLIRDSFSCALAPFLAIQCGRLITIDLRAYSGDLEADIRELDPDAVLVLYTSSTLNTAAMFDFFGEAK